MHGVRTACRARPGAAHAARLARRMHARLVPVAREECGHGLRLLDAPRAEQGLRCRAVQVPGGGHAHAGHRLRGLADACSTCRESASPEVRPPLREALQKNARSGVQLRVLCGGNATARCQEARSQRAGKRALYKPPCTAWVLETGRCRGALRKLSLLAAAAWRGGGSTCRTGPGSAP